jgi:hypothetical protein
MAKFAFWGFSEVELPLYGVLRSSLDARACGNVGPSMNRNSREDYACPLAIQADRGLL